MPASELTDLRLPLADVVEPLPLEQLASDADPPDPLAAAALLTSDIRALAKDSGYSPRQLHRRVLTATGHSPKRLAHIGRMQALLAAGRGESWARTAAEFGYHDESHMINDVRRLADATPQALLADRARSPLTIRNEQGPLLPELVASFEPPHDPGRHAQGPKVLKANALAPAGTASSGSLTSSNVGAPMTAATRRRGRRGRGRTRPPRSPPASCGPAPPRAPRT